MNKANLIDKLAERTGLTKAHCEVMITNFIDTIKEQVVKGEEVKILGFGTFIKYKRKQKIGRNPQTGAEIKIPSTWAVKFRVHEQFKDQIKKK
ncbi:MAG: HU family DNA-binding protein [Leptospiraceae bacterium]|nr:HU family DNA-binding protein [Leptospiraceae bacterium]